MKTHDEMLDLMADHGDAIFRRDFAKVASIADTVHAELKELYTEIERLRALTTWQPIETAPKDGTVIRVCDPSAGFSWRVRWQTFEGHSFWSEVEDGTHPTQYDTLTHWMPDVPLPEPPKEDAS